MALITTNNVLHYFKSNNLIYSIKIEPQLDLFLNLPQPLLGALSKDSKVKVVNNGNGSTVANGGDNSGTNVQ